MKEKCKKCKNCKHFGQLKEDDINIDWCFFPGEQGATATLWSCERWENLNSFKEKTLFKTE